MTTSASGDNVRRTLVEMGTNVCVNLATVDNTATRETKVKVSPSRLHFDNLELWKKAEDFPETVHL